MKTSDDYAVKPGVNAANKAADQITRAANKAQDEANKQRK
jgi:hypothetical protein